MDFKVLLALLQGHQKVFIQTHNFPDHDAIAAGFGLSSLLGNFGIPSVIIYDGEIQRTSLQKMVAGLGIPAFPWREVLPEPTSPLIVIDGCIGNKNVTRIPGIVVGVIDHHLIIPPQEIPFRDHRPKLGSCCTIIFSYFRSLAIPIPPVVASALMIGINIDTCHLTRGTTQDDMEAYTSLFPQADLDLVNSIIRNNTQMNDLAYYRLALRNFKVFNRWGICYFPEGCTQNLLGILGDFFLSLDEVDFVVIAAQNAGRVDLSVRSEGRDLHCSKILHDVLDGLGAGGGHREMAGGVFLLDRLPPADSPVAFLEKRFREALKIKRD